MNFDHMSVDELWELRERLARVLEVKLNAEKQRLEERLIGLARAPKKPEYKPPRRARKKVLRKSRDSSNPRET